MQHLNRSALRKAAASLGIPLSAAVIDQFDNYAGLLLAWNEHTNLTAITDPTEMAIKHIADSLAIARYWTPKPGASLIDVGSGAGLPGLVLKILWPQLQLTVVESVGKKAGFIATAAARLDLAAVTVYADRAEAVMAYEHDRHDVATARGVAALDQVVAWTLPFLRHGGVLFAYKGAKGEAEAAEAAPAIKQYGGGDIRLLPVHIPTLDDRLLIRIRKTADLPPDLRL